jgi:tetratricopeptide (TPR) repeat protein
MLGQARLSLGDLPAALEAAQQALGVQPNSAQALGFAGYMLGRLERYDEAISHLCASLRIEPANWEVLSRLSALLFWTDRAQEMTGWLESALRADPKLAPAHQALGALLHGMGRNVDARRELEEAVRLDPGSGNSHLALSATKTYMPGDPHLALMEQMLQRGVPLPENEQAAFHFALAKAYSDTGAHDRAFNRLMAANRMVRRRFTYDEARTLAAFEHTGSVFTAEFIRAHCGNGDPSRTPVFIVGMPRSGSTLVEQILASHPAVHGAGESRAFLKACAPFVRSYPQDVPALGPTQLRAIAGRYLAEIQDAAPGAERVTDKMLSNFLLVGLIHLALPNARFIHAVRDPVDTCLSCYATHFHESQPFAYDLGELGRYYAAYRRLMDHWHAVLPEGLILDVRYESVVSDLEGDARRMIAHCGLDWNGACLDFAAAKRPVWTASAAQVRRPIYKTSVGRWRPAPHLLKPLLDGLGPSS